MLANAFRRVSMTPAVVLESASFKPFSEPDPARVTPCAFGLSPEFSTPVEKAVEIRCEDD